MKKEVERIMGKEKQEPTAEDYERLIALLEESNRIQEKHIQALEQQVQVLQDILALKGIKV